MLQHAGKTVQCTMYNLYSALYREYSWKLKSCEENLIKTWLKKEWVLLWAK
jgi:hypothetical protein